MWISTVLRRFRNCVSDAMKILKFSNRSYPRGRNENRNKEAKGSVSAFTTQKCITPALAQIPWFTPRSIHDEERTRIQKTSQMESIPNLFFYGHIASIPDSHNGQRRESHICHEMNLGIFKQVKGDLYDDHGHCQRFKEEVMGNLIETPDGGILASVNRAIEVVEGTGSSQFTVVEMDNSIMRGAVAGEAQLIVIREGLVIFQSPKCIQESHRLASSSDLSSGENFGLLFDFFLSEGDVIVFGCGRFWENVNQQKVAMLACDSIKAFTTVETVKETTRTKTSIFDMIVHGLEIQCIRLAKRGMSNNTGRVKLKDSFRNNILNIRSGRNDSFCVTVSLVLDRKSNSIPDVWSVL